MDIVDHIPALSFMLRRIMKSKRVDRFVVATTTLSEDDAIVELCDAYPVSVFRGHPSDVLDRYYHAAQESNAATIVRLTGDCPLHDPLVIDDLVAAYLDQALDYAANAITPTYPDGLDVEAFSMDVLTWLNARAVLSSDREHVTPFLHRNAGGWRVANIAYSEDRSSVRLTLDEPDDLIMIRRVAQALYPGNPDFSLEDMLSYLDVHPEILRINSEIMRNEGYQRSLERD